MKAHFAFWAALLSLPLTAGPLIAQDRAQVLVSKRTAVERFPELGRPGSALNAAFAAEYARLCVEDAPMLRNPRWPELLARQCAERLGMATDVVAPPKPAAEPIRPVVRPAPTDLPSFHEEIYPESGESFRAYEIRRSAQLEALAGRNRHIVRVAAEGGDYMAVYLGYLRVDEERLRAEEQAEEAAGRREDARALAAALQALRLEIQRTNSRP